MKDYKPARPLTVQEQFNEKVVSFIKDGAYTDQEMLKFIQDNNLDDVLMAVQVKLDQAQQKRADRRADYLEDMNEAQSAQEKHELEAEWERWNSNAQRFVRGLELARKKIRLIAHRHGIKQAPTSEQAIADIRDSQLAEIKAILLRIEQRLHDGVLALELNKH